MKLKKREPSGREKDQEAIELLERLREKIYCDNPSAARHASFNLSWMQEDGFEILKEALYSSANRAAKGAAAYGLRKMRGRMKKQAFELLEEGLKHANEGTRQVCARALLLEKQSKQAAKQPPDSQAAPRYRPKPKFRISEISHESPRRIPRPGGKRNPPHISRFNH
jgi:HEAT repeat protein